MTLRKELQQEKKRILTFLENFHKESEHIIEKSVWGKDALQRLFDFTKRGKMLRGALILWSAEWHGVKSEEALPVALAIELTQSALLIHDDIIDEDVLRRGQASIHTRYTKESTKHVLRKEHYGMSMAICLADLSAFLCYNLLAQIDANVLQKVLHLFADSFVTVGLGQMEDVALGLTTSIPTSEEVLRMYKQKTAEYTFCLPLQAGALLAGASEEQLIHLHQLGTNLGVLFQLKDDELGMFGTNGTLGKTVGLDITTGKKTLLYLLLWEQLTSKERTQLQTIQTRKAGKEDMRFISSLLEKYTIRTLSKEHLHKYADVSLQQINHVALPEQAKEILREIVTYNLERES